MRFATWLMLAMMFMPAACRRRGAPASGSGSESSPASARSAEWHDFEQIEYWAPAGIATTSRDGTLPGPEGKGGVPTGVRPSTTLSMPAPNQLYVQLVRSAEPESLAGMKRALDGSKAGTNFVGNATTAGWELGYDMPLGDPGKTTKARIVYVDLAGGHYECSYAEVNCTDPSIAVKICHSLRAKSGK